MKEFSDASARADKIQKEQDQLVRQIASLESEKTQMEFILNNQNQMINTLKIQIEKEKENNKEMQNCLNMYLKTDQKNEDRSNQNKLGAGGSMEMHNMDKNIDNLKSLLIQQSTESEILIKERDSLIEQL